MKREVSGSDMVQPACVVLIDVDRTLLNTDTFSKIVFETMNEIGASKDVTSLISREQSASFGQAYDYIARFQALVADNGVGNIRNAIVDSLAGRYSEKTTGLWYEEFASRIMADGSRELIDGLQDSMRHQPVLCTSGGLDTQMLKLEVIGRILRLDLPWIIVGVDQQRKAEIISTHYDNRRGLFNLTSFAETAQASRDVLDNPALKKVDSIEVIDDKVLNVSNISAGVPVRGWLVHIAEYGPSASDDANRYTLRQLKQKLLEHTIDK